MRRRVPRVRATHLIAALAVLVALSGTAVAANGGAIGLGQRNVASKPTTLTDKRGTPLALVAKHGKPPLSVSGNSTQVPSLNASLLGGLSAASLQPQDKAFTKPGDATFTVPRGFHHMLVLGLGGGGGGGFGLAGGGTGSGGSEGGQILVWTPIAPGSVWTVTVGSGGGPGSAQDLDPLDGRATMVRSPSGASLLYVTGGDAGQNGSTCSAGDTADVPGGDGGQIYGPDSPLAAAGAVVLQGSVGLPGAGTATLCGQSGDGGVGGADSLAGGGGDGGGTGTGTGNQEFGLSGRDGLVIVEFAR
jgi:hypothetical protein